MTSYDPSYDELGLFQSYLISTAQLNLYLKTSLIILTIAQLLRLLFSLIISVLSIEYYNRFINDLSGLSL